MRSHYGSLPRSFQAASTFPARRATVGRSERLASATRSTHTDPGGSVESVATRSPDRRTAPACAGTLRADAWAMIRPVLVLGGPVGGPGAPARRRAPHARHGLPHRALESVEQRLLQRAAGQEPGGLSRAALPRHVADRHLHRPRRLPGLSQPDARDPLATLADRPLPPRLAGRWRLLPDAARGARDRQPRPAHRRRRAPPRRPHARPLHRGPARDRHAGDLRGDPLGAVRNAHRSGGRVLHHHARLHGLGGRPVRDRRHLADRLARPPARPAELRPAAVRSRLPVQPRPLPREHRGRGPLPRRGGRVPWLSRAVRGCGRATGGASCAGRSG